MPFLYTKLIEDVIANRPAAGDKGRRFTSTDTGVEYYDNGTSWDAITISAAQITSGTLPAARLPNPSASTLGGVESIAAVTHQFLTSISTSGVPAQAQPTEADLSLSDITTNNVSITKHGLAPKAPNDATQYLDGTGAYSTPAGTTSGTVTSVGLTVPSRQSVTGSPLTGSGTLAITDNVQNANKVLAGPTTGADASPTFRALVAADIPAIAESGVTNLTTDLAAKVSTSRTISTTAPLTGGGDLSANRTLAISNFVGDSGSGGSAGAVPAPGAGDSASGKFLKADGTFAVPPGTGVAGNKVSLGTYASFASSPPVSPSTGDVFKCTDSSYEFIYDGSTWQAFWQGLPVTVPPSAGWTWDNQGSGTIDTTYGYGYLHAPNASAVALRVQYRTAPATPYTQTFVISQDSSSVISKDGSGTDAGWTVGFRDSAGKMVALMVFIVSSGGATGEISTTKWTNSTTKSADYLAWGPALGLYGTVTRCPMFAQITDNGTNLIFRLSIDGKHWYDFDTRARTDFMASGPTQFFWGAYPKASAVEAMLISLTAS